MIDKTVASAAEAVADIPDGRLSPSAGSASRQPHRLDRGAARPGDPRPLGRVEQLRRRRLGARHSARGRSHPQDDLVVRRREQGVRAAVPLRRTRTRAHPAGHPRREAAGRRVGHRSLLHADRCGHAGRRGRPAASLRRRRRHRRGIPGQRRAHLRRERRATRVRARRSHHHRLLARARRTRATATATSSSARPRAPSTPSPRWPDAPASCRWSTSSNPESSTRMPCTCPASTCTASSRSGPTSRSASRSALFGRGSSDHAELRAPVPSTGSGTSLAWRRSLRQAQGPCDQGPRDQGPGIAPRTTVTEEN